MNEKARIVILVIVVVGLLAFTSSLKPRREPRKETAAQRRERMLNTVDARGSAPFRRAEQEAVWRRLLELIHHPDAAVRAEAVGATGRFPADGQAIVGVIDSLRTHDPDNRVRWKARVAWSDLTGRDSWEGLMKASRGWKDSSRNR